MFLTVGHMLVCYFLDSYILFILQFYTQVYNYLNLYSSLITFMNFEL